MNAHLLYLGMYVVCLPQMSFWKEKKKTASKTMFEFTFEINIAVFTKLNYNAIYLKTRNYAAATFLILALHSKFPTGFGWKV